MNKQERQVRLLDRIQQEAAGRTLSTRELADEFAVSEITMRRDLQDLAAAGKIQRTHGGVARRPLPERISYDVGIILVSYRGKFSNPFFNELLEGADTRLEALGCRVVFWKTMVDVSSPVQVEELQQAYPVDGLLVIGGYDAARAKLWGAWAPALVAAPNSATPTVDRVTIDSDRGMQAMVAHLVGLGRRRIGFIMGHDSADRADERLAGYRAGMVAAGLETDPDLVFEAVHSLERLPAQIGQAGAKRLMEAPNPPDAVMCSSDLIALSAMHWLQAQGYRVPDDVAVTGFDNIIDSSIAFPPLTTVHVHKSLLGRLAAELLVRRIEQPDDPPLEIVTPTELVVRKSCGAAASV